MQSSGEKFFISLATGESLLGILVNGFIVLVNFIEWIKSKKLPQSDLILVSLAISRIGLLCTLLSNSCSTVNFIDKPTQIRIIDILMGVTQSSNIWFATTLSIFYFLKIANFSNPFFLWMKWRINRIIFVFLMVPFIIYLSLAIAMIEVVNYNYSGDFFSRGKERNVSQEVQVSKNMFLIFQVLCGLMSFIPFTLSIVSFSLLILSLWRHTRQMQVNATGSRDPSTEAHVRAMKAVSSFLVLCLLYYMALFASLWSITEENKLLSMLSMSVILLHPFGHSLILILWNSKLRKAALRVLSLTRCCQRGSHLQALWMPLWIIWHFLRGKKAA